MSVRAQWFVPGLGGELDDPFADDEDPVETGVPVDLTGQLSRRLVDLLEAEELLKDDGLTCKLKDRQDTCCHACPKRGVKGELCEVGIEQEKIVGELAVKSFGA